jgi:hypothetical protein
MVSEVTARDQAVDRGARRPARLGDAVRISPFDRQLDGGANLSVCAGQYDQSPGSAVVVRQA